MQNRESRAVTPEKYLVFRLNQKSLKNALGELPLENTDAAREKSLIVEIPGSEPKVMLFEK